jgi:hypothetical protein
MFLSRPRATKGKTSPNLHADFSVLPRDSDSECSAYPSGLLTYIIHPCTPSPLASRCQLAPPAPSPLAHELTLRRRCISLSQLASAAARSLCSGCPAPDTFCTAAAASPYHRLRPVPSGTRTVRRRCAPPTAAYASAAAVACSTCSGDPAPARPTSPPPPARASSFARPQVRTLTPPPLRFPLSPRECRHRRRP